MKQTRQKVYNFFLSTTLGAWCLAFLLALFFVALSAIYLFCQGTSSENFIKELEPLAVLIIGLASVIIATSNFLGKKRT